MADTWPEITLEEAYKGLTESLKDAAMAKVREWLTALRPYSADLVAVRIAVETESSSVADSAYRVRVRLTARGHRELVVSREPADNPAGLPLTRVLEEAFEVSLRQLRETLEQQRSSPHRRAERELGPEGVGIVLRIDPGGRYGHLKATDGREVYFAESALVNREFDALDVGAKVRFEAVPPDDGQSPRATTVHVLDPRGGSESPIEVDDPPGWSRST